MMDDIVNLLKSRGMAMDIYEIAHALNKPADDAYGALFELVRAGVVTPTKKGRYMMSESAGLVPARTLVLRSGAPAARPLDGSADMLIRERGAMRPMVDDLILVKPDPHRGEGMGRCRLVSITRRAHEQFMAVLTMTPVQIEERPRRKAKKSRRDSAPHARTTYVPELRPVDPRIVADIQLEGDLRGARSGDMVLLRVTGWPERGVKLRAAIERVMGDADDIRVKLKAVALSHGLHEAFPPDAVKQADAVPAQVDEADLSGRTDFRDLALFTIDGDDAQDFDDAVSLQPIEGGYLLGVHIADVSHYVRPRTPIDREAEERGTSVYLPGLTLPMLPEALSNHMCSLMPDVDRLAMSLIMEIRDGSVTDHTLAPSVIRSRARLTYAQVNRMLDGFESDVPESLRDTLRDMAAVAGTLRERRHARGSIDFDMPETAFTLDADGRPTDVRARSRGEAERMIEDFMLLANETVARLARTTQLPFLYRVHAKPDPDRVRSLTAFLNGLGIRARLGNDPKPSQFQKILDDVQDKSEAALVKQVMLRSLRRAEYAPEPEGHFGLAARDYCHFTSPIRRYPDLEVHRMLKLLLAGGAASWARYEKRMPDLAKRCTDCEQRATMAERDADDLLKAHYMAGRVGETFDGVVTGVTAWGVYVALENTVEGLIPIRSLEGDYVLDDARQTLRSTRGGRAFRLGDAVRVVVERVDTALSQIDFAPAD